MKEQSAFPHEGIDNGPGNCKGKPEKGLSKLEYFAAQAMLGLLSNSNATSYTDENIAENAIDLAKELIKQLENK